MLKEERRRSVREQGGEEDVRAYTGRDDRGLEKTAQWGASWLVLLTKNYPADQICKK